ncbi:hypothetical protein Tgr7_2680 [Thioalkalivibrio sulfidiphilus HL-EbGr7]|uniref:Uncharacterized protein n=1 Tax=Thioalkalivibrio sulfidiphilus (strain HL-EbGR7) TaxID=396588 RepID=B8GMU0_THISH|nr:hypothetical protein Tgr7_2680 [Thioalkalivibrio sulfidiphilus HL-EbGr7]
MIRTIPSASDYSLAHKNIDNVICITYSPPRTFP